MNRLALASYSCLLDFSYPEGATVFLVDQALGHFIFKPVSVALLKKGIEQKHFISNESSGLCLQPEGADIGKQVPKKTYW
ncbi:hypothetical protein, partial [Immundisolibacter sp.]